MTCRIVLGPTLEYRLRSKAGPVLIALPCPQLTSADITADIQSDRGSIGLIDEPPFARVVTSLPAVLAETLFQSLKRRLVEIRQWLLLDYHWYANPSFDGSPENHALVAKRRLALLRDGRRLIARYGSALEDVISVCVFVGYPRSGHSLVGSLIDSHPHAVLAHEFNVMALVSDRRFTGPVLQSLLVEHSAQTAQTGRVWSHGHDYTLAGAYQGTFKSPLRVVGDKKGGATARLLAEQPSVLDHARVVFGPQLRFVVHVRNPFDVVATMSRRSGSSAVTWEVVGEYGRATEGIQLAIRGVPSSHLYLGHHDLLLSKPRQYLEPLADFLGLEPEPDWLDSCITSINRKPNPTRYNVSWPAGTREAIANIAAEHVFLAGYNF